MYAVNVKVLHESNTGVRTVQAFLVSDNSPESLPTTGEGVTGLLPTDVFAPFSILYVLADVENKIYITNESGMFMAQ